MRANGHTIESETKPDMKPDQSNETDDTTTTREERLEEASRPRPCGEHATMDGTEEWRVNGENGATPAPDARPGEGLEAGAHAPSVTDQEQQVEVAPSASRPAAEAQVGESAATAEDSQADQARPVAAPDPEPERRRLEVPETAEADQTFEQLGVPPDLLQGIASLGYAQPTAVQAAIYQRALDNHDLIVRSKTGTGKTAAFMLPILARIPADARQTKALVLVPTRELATQVADEGAAIAAFRSISIVPIYGGVGLGQQADKLRAGAEVVVGTPGRTLDHIRRGNLDLSHATFVVLDEADEMLSMGFLEEVTAILKHVPPDHQTLLLSATVGATVAGIISQFMRDPDEIFLSTDVRTVEGIRNILFECSDAYPKARSLLYALYLEDPESAIIFCNTRDDCAFVSAYLRRQGFDVEFINSDLSQAERTRVMSRIKRGELSFLVATDIAARGIDISDLTHVINYSLPDDPDLYLHRVGRTGRIGKLGTAITLVSGRDLSAELALERRYHIPFEHKSLPDPEEATKLWTLKHLGLLREAADRLAYETYLPMVRYMVQSLPDDERDRLFAAALRTFFSWDREQARQDEDTGRQTGPAGGQERRARSGAPGADRGPRRRSRRRDERPRDDRRRDPRSARRPDSRRSSRYGPPGPRSDERPARDDRGTRDDRDVRGARRGGDRRPGRRSRRGSGQGTAPPTDILDPLAAFAAANDIDLGAWIESDERPGEEGHAPTPRPASGRKRRRGGRRRRRSDSAAAGAGETSPAGDRAVATEAGGEPAEAPLHIVPRDLAGDADGTPGSER